ncbi:DUF397 domain-containing protein [Streptomyces sp. DSM 44917]|uniref:DUF397 domain-containing protein n=1 Tax=Streptomyces boetiae TaxID=3075541 RepID=A0ABU2L1J1_9ACTN|nr:DUF397 domain-containing protein [Streptomyces sp. DSM 44917]MDT0305432.1 DUF397 domain-containing protein [Streptomyces sp. DSM 44917]
MRHGLPEDRWVKSSYSSSVGNDCVEFQPREPGRIAVRDSKRPELGAYVFPGTSWAAFVEGVRAGRL